MHSILNIIQKCTKCKLESIIKKFYKYKIVILIKKYQKKIIIKEYILKHVKNQIDNLFEERLLVFSYSNFKKSSNFLK